MLWQPSPDSLVGLHVSFAWPRKLFICQKQGYWEVPETYCWATEHEFRWRLNGKKSKIYQTLNGEIVRGKWSWKITREIKKYIYIFLTYSSGTICKKGKPQLKYSPSRVFLKKLVKRLDSHDVSQVLTFSLRLMLGVICVIFKYVTLPYRPPNSEENEWLSLKENLWNLEGLMMYVVKKPREKLGIGTPSL